uniref:Uncharacterized protein n=1 Tax=Ananas comosus var. bracteatus TaxID=296719 RepID=A0A6V7QL68_ANACO|nr:unnamed protein product [Ananas comosus var. bracteatus]
MEALSHAKPYSSSHLPFSPPRRRPSSLLRAHRSPLRVILCSCSKNQFSRSGYAFRGSDLRNFLMGERVIQRSTIARSEIAAAGPPMIRPVLYQNCNWVRESEGFAFTP